MAKASAAAKKRDPKVDPFKTKKTKTPSADVNDTLTPPREIQKAIDSFRECQDQAKHFEGEATIYKDQILDYAQGQFTERVFEGLNKSFKILGDETMITYIVMDSSAGLTEEDLSEFTDRWGKAAAEELIVRDYGSIKFDPEVFEANYDAVVEALQVLPPTVLENLFKPMLMKAAPQAVEKAKRFAKKPDDMRELIKQLKIKNYIK